MSHIVIAFPKLEVAQNLKKLLSQSGYTVTAAVNSGSAALQAMGGLDHSILICAPRFRDMIYQEINDCLTNGNQMLLVATQEMWEPSGDILCIRTPLQVHELLETIRMMDESLYRLRRKQRNRPKLRSEEDRALIRQAKELLMTRNCMTEDEAHRYIQKRAMDNGTGLIETAQMIVALNNN